jgi:hypothetical protein
MLELGKKDLDGPWNVLVIGGEKLASSEMLNAFVGKWSGWIYSEIDSRKLFPLTLQDIGRQVHSLVMNLDDEVDHLIRLHKADLIFASYADPQSILTLIFKPDFDNWASPFSASDYLQAFKESAVGSSIGNPVFNADITEGFKVTRVLKEMNASLGEEISHAMSEVKRLSSASEHVCLAASSTLPSSLC